MIFKSKEGGGKMEIENKFGKISTVEEAMKHINDGCTIMIAGFGGIGLQDRKSTRLNSSHP